MGLCAEEMPIFGFENVPTDESWYLILQVPNFRSTRLTGGATTVRAGFWLPLWRSLTPLDVPFRLADFFWDAVVGVKYRATTTPVVMIYTADEIGRFEKGSFNNAGQATCIGVILGDIHYWYT
jgi:hypothetical protein